ncbi:MAG TPA: EH signature domain-containing protein [Stellaceae bacterium]|nr:EH signature domain-containing protein [Stellaceae bacterium]
MLRAALAKTSDFGFPRRLALAPPQAPDIARRLAERYGDGSGGASKPADALQALLQRLRAAHYDWDQVVPSDRLDVAWVLWEGATPPAEHEAFLRGFLEWVASSQRRLQALRLAASWTAAFDPTLKSIRIAGEWLACHAAWLPSPWPALAREFEIFSLETGAAALAAAFLASEETSERFFRRLRLPPRAAAGGLAFEMLAAATADTGRRLSNEPRLALRLCDLALHGEVFRPDAAPRRAARRARALRCAIAEALLLPWQRQAPPSAVQAQTLAFLIRHYGDARITGEHWMDMRAPSVAIMRRWLTERSIENYFQLAGRTKSADRARLAECREFWLSRRDQLDGAWLLGSVHSVAKLGPDQPAYGRLSGCRPDQAGLLLRIGGATVLQSSEAASESVWLPGNPLAPPLYRCADQAYWPAALARGADFSPAYCQKGNDTGQERLARFIDRQYASTMAA